MKKTGEMFGIFLNYHYLCKKYIYNKTGWLMIRRLLVFSTALSLTMATPAVLYAADAEKPAIEQVVSDDAVITVSGQTVTVAGAQGQTLEVVSLTGRRMMSVKIESPAQRVELNIPKGCYILKIGKIVRKVTIR